MSKYLINPNPVIRHAKQSLELIEFAENIKADRLFRKICSTHAKEIREKKVIPYLHGTKIIFLRSH